MKYLEMLEEVEDKGSVELNLEQFYDILDVYKKEVVFKSLDKVSSIEGEDIEIDTPNTMENFIIDMGFLVYDATEMYKKFNDKGIEFPKLGPLEIMTKWTEERDIKKKA